MAGSKRRLLNGKGKRRAAKAVSRSGKENGALQTSSDDRQRKMADTKRRLPIRKRKPRLACGLVPAGSDRGPPQWDHAIPYPAAFRNGKFIMSDNCDAHEHFSLTANSAKIHSGM